MEDVDAKTVQGEIQTYLDITTVKRHRTCHHQQNAAAGCWCWTSMQLKVSDFFSVKDDMMQPTCETLAMLLHQVVQTRYLHMHNEGENQNLAKKMKNETGD